MSTNSLIRPSKDLIIKLHSFCCSLEKEGFKDIEVVLALCTVLLVYTGDNKESVIDLIKKSVRIDNDLPPVSTVGQS